MLPIAQGGAVGSHQLHEGHGENLLAFVFSWERQKHEGGEGSVETARGAAGWAGRGSPSCACHRSAAGRWCRGVGAAGSTVGTVGRGMAAGMAAGVSLWAAGISPWAAGMSPCAWGQRLQQPGKEKREGENTNSGDGAERGARGPCEDTAGLGAGGVWLVQDQACEHPTQLQVPAAAPCRWENPGAWDFQLHQQQHLCSRPHAAAHGLPAAKSHRRQSRRQAPSPGSCLAAMSRRSAASPRAAGTEQSRDDGLPPPA